MSEDHTSHMNNAVKSGATLAYWCGICSAEPAERSIEIELGEQWVPLMVGEECLSKFPAPEEN